MPEQPKIHQMARPESFCFQVAKARRQSRMWHVCTVIQNMWDIPDSRCPVFWIYILHFFKFQVQSIREGPGLDTQKRL